VVPKPPTFLSRLLRVLKRHVVNWYREYKKNMTAANLSFLNTV